MSQSIDSRSKLEVYAIAIIAVVQFVNIVDFMMVMPLGPDLAHALGIRVSHLGVVAGSYTLAAALSGFMCSFFIDRMDRKRALFWAVLGLAFGTLTGALAFNFHSLLWARVLAGVFGGPATSVGLSIIGDIVPHHRRGKALGAVMMAFSAASIFGVPLGLELARVGTWQTPFLVVGVAGLLSSAIIWWKLPSMTGHLAISPSGLLDIPVRTLLTQRTIVLSYLLTLCFMMSGFLIFPNISSYLQLNLGFPRSEMSQLYFVGGLISLIAMRFCGGLVDRFGSVPWFTVGSFGFLFALVAGFYVHPPWINAYGIFICIMFFGTFRNVSANTLTSKVPPPELRAGFLSLQSAVQHLATAFGAIFSSRILTTGLDGKLEGTDELVLASGCLVIFAAIAVVILQSKVRSHEH